MQRSSTLGGIPGTSPSPPLSIPPSPRLGNSSVPRGGPGSPEPPTAGKHGQDAFSEGDPFARTSPAIAALAEAEYKQSMQERQVLPQLAFRMLRPVGLKALILSET